MTKEHQAKRGMLVVLSGPSGVGKGTIVHRYLAQHPDVKLSVSGTTRPPREGEGQGIHYYFYTQEEFKAEIEADGMLEYAYYRDNYYGTPKRFVEEVLAEGGTIILEIEVEGAGQIREIYPDALFVFVVPPSFAVLGERLQKRATESGEAIAKRLAVAKEEMKRAGDYDYIIVNDQVERAADCLDAVIKAKGCTLPYQTKFIEEVLENA